jgi:protoporphyrinogen oxidase
MAMNSEAPGKYGYSDGGLEQRVAAVEDRLAAVEKIELTAEFNALRVEIAKIPFETVKGLAVILGFVAAITAVATFWFL